MIDFAANILEGRWVEGVGVFFDKEKNRSLRLGKERFPPYFALNMV